MSHPLCYRCEWRAQFLENGRRPRSECGDIEKAVGGCYMFQPVRPLWLEPSNKKDPRPFLGPPMLASRARSAGVCEDFKARAMEGEKGVCVYWAPAG
jgi:hypothetical protein